MRRIVEDVLSGAAVLDEWTQSWKTEDWMRPIKPAIAHAKITFVYNVDRGSPRSSYDMGPDDGEFVLNNKVSVLVVDDWVPSVSAGSMIMSDQ